MAARRRGSRVKGAGRVRKMLKRLPDNIGAEIVEIYRKDGPTGLAYAKGSTPRRTGKLANALQLRIFAKTLKMRIGVFGKMANRDVFYGRILEYGRRAQTVMVRRRVPVITAERRKVFMRRRRSIISATYAMRVSGIARGTYDIVAGRVAKFVFGLIRPKLITAYQAALRKAAAGAGPLE